MNRKPFPGKGHVPHIHSHPFYCLPATGRTRGLLKLTTPAFIAKEYLQELLPGYLNTYPNVSVELTAVDRFVDLIDEGFDLALRAGDLSDSTLVARLLMDTKLVLVASSTYPASNGTPETAAQLKTHNCLIDTASGYGDR